MPVFKLCIKIFKSKTKMILLYFAIFIFMSSMVAINASSSTPTGFTMSKTRIAIISHDDSPFVDGLKENLSEITEFVSIKDNKQAIQDALYYGEIRYFLRIPANFTEDILLNKAVQLEKTSLPGAYSNLYIDLKIDQYLNTARLYINQNQDINIEQLKNDIQNDLKKVTNVDMLNKSNSPSNVFLMKYYFNFMAYTFIFIIIIGVSTVMLIFNSLNIKRRNACSPINASRFTFEFFLAIMCFTLVSWLVLVGVSLYFGRSEITNPNTIYYVINSLIFALTSGAVSFLIGNLVKNRESISAIANLYTLGSCFLSGVFVPQEIMSSSVLKIASFLPTYWYVKANAQISTINKINWNNFDTLPKSFAIQIAFFLAFFILAMVIGKHKRLSTQEN